MGTPSLFNDAIRSQLKISAAWLPITNTFKLGDYGVMSEGVFVKLGNIERELNVHMESALGPTSVLNFTTKGTSEARLAADATVDAFPDSDVNAKLVINFKNESSFFLKANLTVLQMQNINQVAYQIYNHPKWGDWRYKFRVVSATYTGKDCALISSLSKNSSIELTGKAKALKQLDLGAVSVGVTAGSKKEIGLDLVGATGIVGLSFFKLTWLDGANPKILGDEQRLPPEMFADDKALARDDV